MEKSGIKLVAIFLALSIASSFLNFYLALIFLFFALFTLFFFREPERSIGEGVVSPADGRVIKIEGNRLEIFMSLLDAHITLSPVSGIIENISYKKGKFKPAFSDTSQNEKNRIIIKSEDGEFAVEQIAGVFARRIICHVGVGDWVKKGQKIGMIVFGSRVALEIPENYRFTVNIGEKVKAGQTVAVKK